MRSVTIVDYGMGNLLSVERALRSCGADEVERTSDPEAVAHAEVLVLPGVGAFADGMAELRERDLVEPLRERARADRPMLAICLGMHMVFERSLEFGQHDGLGLLPGTVVPLPRADAEGRRLKTPHIGWNALVPTADWDATVLSDVTRDDWFYFVHSFVAEPAEETHRVADVFYGGAPVAAVVAAGNLVGTQFHPEKSGPAGLRLISKFVATHTPAG